MGVDLRQTKEILEQHDYSSEDESFDVYEYYSTYIGNYIIAFSELEHSLERYLADCVSSRSHDLGYQTMQFVKDFKYKCALLKNLLWTFLDSKQRDNLEVILRDLEEIYEFRNIVCHSKWYLAKKNKSVRVKFQSDKDGLIEFKNCIVDKREFIKHINKVRKSVANLDNFFENSSLL